MHVFHADTFKRAHLYQDQLASSLHLHIICQFLCYTVSRQPHVLLTSRDQIANEVLCS